ncbi:MAG: Abi family protein [[Clostridium] fimetarium]|nr:Abi family protein [Alistipes timonensis]MCM1406701.1 Abi family protein [[Clostridium] fimetarium]
MRYDKHPIDFPAQIALLKDRGMAFSDEDKALQGLFSISYFRLASYWRHRENRKSRQFKADTKFDDVLTLYTFDQHLRNIIFSAIQNIEIAFRTRVSHFLSMKYGAFWFLDSALFKDAEIHQACIEKLKEEIARSHEEFIKEHNDKYDEPNCPPSWKTMEVASFGTLSKLYSNIADNEIKKIISRSFELPSYLFLENWMKCAAVLRNCCAHHARLWNRRFSVIPKYPANLPRQWIATPLHRPEKLYGQLCCLAYLGQSIQLNNSLKRNILDLMSDYPEIDLNAMGFQSDWQEQPLWK